MKASSKWFIANPARTYTVSVAAVSPTGSVGNFSSNAVIVPNKKAILPVAPTNLTVKNGVKRVTLSWPKSPEKDYKHTSIYRSASNNFANADEIGQATGTSFVDDDLDLDVNYYYWITFNDKSGNESAKFPNANNGGKVGQADRVKSPLLALAAVQAQHTDPAVLAAPAGTPGLISDPQDVDVDGKLDVALTTMWSAVLGAVRYEIEISRGTSAIGPWTVENKNVLVGANVTAYSFKALTKYFYRTRIRAYSFNGTAGSWSATQASGVRPLAATGAPPTPVLSMVLWTIGGILIQWETCPAPDYRYTEVYLLENPDASKTVYDAYLYTTVQGTIFTDRIGSSDMFKYYFRHVNYSGQKSGWMVSNGGPGGYTQRLVAPWDIEDGAIETSKIVDQAVTAAKLATGAVTNSKIADNAINNAKIASNAVTADSLANDAVITAKIGASAVTKHYQAANSANVAISTTQQTLVSDDISPSNDYEGIYIAAACFMGANASA